ncbi:MAG: FAD-binding protein, partial [Firmicutes bacterium]|nr:FAD-binding protein [Bacillota bacterium]
TYTDEVQYLSGPVIIACGGLNGFFPEFTTGTVANTGDLAAELFSEGVEFANLEFIQYHPTTVAIPGKRMLISEAARGEGGRLFIERSGKKWYFMEELYPELGNLMPRDVISREMTRVLARDDCEGPVCLDMTGISKKTWEKKLSDLREEIREYLSIDPAKEPVSVYPGIHFFMGGIRVDEEHKTSMENLFAAGECACQYHGANRLGGNSMLGAIYGGRIAAQSAMKLEHENYEEKPSYHISAEEKQEFYVSPKSAAELKGILADSLGIIRTGNDLNKGIERIDNLLKDNNLTAMEKKRILLGKAMILSALAREESRGAHFREDYPETDEAYRKTTVSRMGDGIEIYFRDIPERRESHEIQN